MYQLQPFFNDNFLILKLYGELTAEEALNMAQDTYRIVEKIRGKFGVVTDMRELKNISDDAKDIITESIKELKKMGLSITARVFKDRNDPSIRTWQEISSKASYTANYFVNIDKAIGYIKESLKERN